MANYAWFTKAHRFVYENTGGRIGHYLGKGRCMALMYTIGAKSGEVRAIPLMYYPIVENGIVVLASNNGQDKHPAWYHNLKAHPEIDVRVGTEKRRVRAEEVGDEKRDELWQKMVAYNPEAAVYQSRTQRKIPIMLLRTLSVY